MLLLYCEALQRRQAVWDPIPPTHMAIKCSTCSPHQSDNSILQVTFSWPLVCIWGDHVRPRVLSFSRLRYLSPSDSCIWVNLCHSILPRELSVCFVFVFVFVWYRMTRAKLWSKMEAQQPKPVSGWMPVMVWEVCSCLGGCIGTVCVKSNVSVFPTLIWLVMFPGLIILGQRQILSANWNLWCMKFLGSLFPSVDISIGICNGFIWLFSLFGWPEVPYQCANKGAFSIFNFKPFLPVSLRNLPFLLTRQYFVIRQGLK